jgi:hypothetical protein
MVLALAVDFMYDALIERRDDLQIGWASLHAGRIFIAVALPAAS